ncbi:ECF transporter S component [Guggenheimella bovis]
MKVTTKTLVKIAVLAAVATVLSYLETPLAIFPNFMKIDISTLPAVIAGFALGPMSGFMVEVIKNLFHLIGSQTGGVGELANILIGGSFVLISSIIYKNHKTRKSALTGLFFATLGMIFMGVLSNKFLLLPYYANVMKFPIEAIVGMANAINPKVTSLTTYLLWVVAPFNLIKGAILSLLTFLVYKRISPILHR